MHIAPRPARSSICSAASAANQKIVRLAAKWPATPRWLLSLIILLAASVLLRGDPAPAPPDKDAFRSHKKWYVSFVLSLHGKGEVAKTNGRDTTKVKWNIRREVSGTFELDKVQSGFNSRPRKSEPLKGESPENRFTSWSTVEGLSSVSWMIDDKIEHEVVTHGEGGHPTNWTGFSKLSGASVSQIGRFKELKCDLKEMVYDMELSGLRQLPGEATGAPKPLRFNGEYHISTPVTRVHEDKQYPLLESQSFGALPGLTGQLSEQLQSRKLELVNDKITINVSHPVVELPSFPNHPGSNPPRSDTYINYSTKGGPPLELSLQIIISPTPPSTAKLVLKPIGYDIWRPRCGVSEDVKGNDLGIEWRVEEEGAANPPKITRVSFSLLNVSREPGVCMNWPLQPKSPPDFDLQFPGALAAPRPGIDVKDKGQTLVLTDAPANAGKGTITVDCFDSGATGMLVAEATLVDGRILKATVEKSGDPQLMIPDHQPWVSAIARKWREVNAPRSYDSDDDEDAPKGDGQRGDGFTVWEEYRGFWVNGAWNGNCNPKVKDLFVYNGIGDEAYAGILLFESATGLSIHQRLAFGEFKADRVMNFNHGSHPHLVDQHCLVLTEGGFEVKADDGAIMTGSICRAREGIEFPGPPKNTWEVSVLPSMLRGTQPVWQKRNGEAYQVASADRTIAHELGHGLGIRHHGDKDRGYRPWKYEEAPGGGFMVWADGAQVFVRDEKTKAIMLPSDLFIGLQPGEEKQVWIGERQGQMSGDEACFMRYVLGQAYRSQSEPNLLYYHWDREIWGNRLCTSPAGTGVNMPTHEPQSRYGGADTGRGNCVHKFVVSDRWEKKN